MVQTSGAALWFSNWWHRPTAAFRFGATETRLASQRRRLVLRGCCPALAASLPGGVTMMADGAALSSQGSSETKRRLRVVSAIQRHLGEVSA